MAEVDDGWTDFSYEVRWVKNGESHTKSFAHDLDSAKALVEQLPADSHASLARMQSISATKLFGPQPSLFGAIVPAEKKSEHKQVIALWTELFAAERGCKPTWGAKQGSLVKRLIKQHGSDEVLRRIEVCFSDPPDWPMRPDFSAFAQHFDLFSGAKLEPKKKAGSRLSVSEILGGKSDQG